MKKILRDLKEKDLHDSIELDYKNKGLIIRKKVINKKRTRSIKINLKAKEAERMMFFLEDIFYEKNEPC